VRRYSDKSPDWKKIIRAIDMARYAPAAGNNFILRFILIDDKKKIEALARASQQDFVGTAKYVVAAVSEDSKLVRLYRDRGKRFSPQQAGAAIQNFLLALTEEGYVTTWVGHFVEDQVKDILGVSSGATVEAIFPIGIETKVKTNPTPKLALENILYFNKWKEKKMVGEVRVGIESV
jgi:nitroreductase